MPDRALRQPASAGHPEQAPGSLNASNARQGIKTLRLIAASSSAIAFGLNASNARQGIKTINEEKADLRTEAGLNASNARQGIKTMKKVPIALLVILRLNASNARQGIKTEIVTSPAACPASASERLQCPTGH